MPASRPPSGPGGRGTPGRPARTAPAGGPAGDNGPRFTSRAIVLGLVLLVLLISYASSVRAWLDQRQQIAEAEHQIESVQDQIDDLEREKRRFTDDVYIEQQARARFGYVLPGETGYRVITPDGETLDSPDLPEPAVEPPNWYDTLWASARRAGRER